jgi:hypothetical protein
MLLSLFNKHAPERTVHIRRKPCPWFSGEISGLRREKDRARRTYLRTGCQIDLQRYKRLRNGFKTACRKAKLVYYNSLFQQNQPSSSLWKNVRQLGAAPSKQDALIPIPLNDLNVFFATPMPPSVFPDFVTSTAIRNNFSHSLPPDRFFFSHVSPDEVSNAISSIVKNGKGIDGIPITFYKKILPVLLPAITHIFNCSLQTGVFPVLWKYSIIYPIPKKPNPSSPQDYRPISMLCSLSKALEKIVHGQVTSYLNSFDFFAKYQSGFRPFHSTATSLLKITDDVRAAMDQKRLSLIVSFDFTKAFDNVPHSLLINKLETQCNFSASSLSWFSSYLTGRSQAVRGHGGGVSEWMPVSVGVPQGSVLGPLLFSIYINNIALITSYSSYHLYADDLVLYSHFPLHSFTEAVIRMNADISSLVLWSRAHFLTLNPNKCKCMVMGYRRIYSQINYDLIPRVHVDGIDLEYGETLQLLGIHLDSTLSWAPQVRNVTGKVFASMHQLKRLRRFLPVPLRITLVQALILPLLDYCSVVYNDLSDELNSKLQRALNYSIRFIFDAKRDDHITPFFTELRWLKLKSRRQYFLLSIMFNLIVKRTGPQYLFERLTLMADVHSRTTRSHDLFLQIPHHRTSIFNSSFIVSASRSWNALPHHVLSSPSIQIFKSRLQTHLLGENR